MESMSASVDGRLTWGDVADRAATLFGGMAWGSMFYRDGYHSVMWISAILVGVTWVAGAVYRHRAWRESEGHDG